MRFDMGEMGLLDRYKLIHSTITPRPIAWVTTMSADGRVNAAPYSLFNACGIEPPLVMLGLLKDFRTRELKDTATNILATGEYVVNLVCEADAEKMNLSSVDAPRDISEVDYAGLDVIASDHVAPPRIATSPVSFECRKVSALDIGTMQTIVIGEVLAMHVADEFITDPDKLYFDTPGMQLIGRTHGRGWYARTSDQFAIERPLLDAQRVDDLRAEKKS